MNFDETDVTYQNNLKVFWLSQSRAQWAQNYFVVTIKIISNFELYYRKILASWFIGYACVDFVVIHAKVFLMFFGT